MAGRCGVHLLMSADEGVVARAVEVIAIDEVARLLGTPDAACFSDGERAYAGSTVDPERRLAARLAAKRAASRLLGSPVTPADVEVVRDRTGPRGCACRRGRRPASWPWARRWPWSA